MSIFPAGYLNSHKDNADNAIDTEKVQRALKYMKEESLKQPHIILLFNKWVEVEKMMEFESYAKMCALPTTATYRANSFTSSQEDSLAKHKENINLCSSNSCPHTPARKSPPSHECPWYLFCFLCSTKFVSCSTKVWLPFLGCVCKSLS